MVNPYLTMEVYFMLKYKMYNNGFAEPKKLQYF